MARLKNGRATEGVRRKRIRASPALLHIAASQSDADGLLLASSEYDRPSATVLSRDRLQHGLSPNELAKRVKAGSLVRVRQGVYTEGAAWKGLQPWEQYRLRVQAAAETFEKPTVFARHSAASVWGIPTIGRHHPVQALTMGNDGGRSRSGVRRHFGCPSGLAVVCREGLLVTGRVRTVLDLADFVPFTEAAAPLDDVLRPDRARQLHALTRDQLEADIGSNYSAAAGRRIRAAIAFADALSGSPGSRSAARGSTWPASRPRSCNRPFTMSAAWWIRRLLLEAGQGGWRIRWRGEVRQTRVSQWTDGVAGGRRGKDAREPDPCHGGERGEVGLG